MRSNVLIELLENRQLLSAAHSDLISPPHRAAAHRAVTIPAGTAQIEQALGTPLAPSDVSTILAQAASQALPTQVITVVDRGGLLLGMYAGSGVNPAYLPALEFLSLQRANTAAFFESTQDAFSSRTARFIIQNHFPQPIANTPGGPLYGVEFSDFPGGDILPVVSDGGATATGISGDPGGMPLFIGDVPVGGIGVAGDGNDQAPNTDLANVLENELPQNLINTGTPALVTLGQSLMAYETFAQHGPNGKLRLFGGPEVRDFDESVAEAGNRGYSPPAPILASNITVAGLRLPYTASPIAQGKPLQTLTQLVAEGGTLVTAPTISGRVDATPVPVSDTEEATIPTPNGVVDGQYITNGITGATLANPTIASSVPLSNGQPGLTTTDVNQILTDAVNEAVQTRAGIRKPNGVKARIFAIVVDTQGNVLGEFRLRDATNFSYDVAIQKARTAAFFSDDTHAFTTTAIGFMSQRFFAPGINDSEPGPLYQLQDKLMDNPANLGHGPLANGITIFPGGVPLYKNGLLVGAVGISGDGVVNDDQIAFGGEEGFRPPDGIRSDQLLAGNASNFLVGKLKELAALPNVNINNFSISTAATLLKNGLTHVHLPYIKEPRVPDTV